jgi:hypothetical protein
MGTLGEKGGFMRSFSMLGSAIASVLLLAVLAGTGGSLLGVCGPFTDVSDAAFCPFVLEILTLGITTGTTPTTYDPSDDVSRLQMAAFLSRTVDGVLRRGSRRAALGRFGTPQGTGILGQTTVDFNPDFAKSDGADVWVTCQGSVARVRASDGKLLGTWTASSQLSDPLVIAFGKVLTPGLVTPGKLYMVDPTQPPGAATIVASNLGNQTEGIAFDGARVWTSNHGPPGSVSIVTPGTAIPWTVTTVTTGFSSPIGALFDGANVWIADGSLKKLDAAGAVIQSVFTTGTVRYPVFDGTNIWSPDSSDDSVTVVRASTGAVLRTLTGNGLSSPVGVAFDGERIMVANPPADSVSLWKAADLTPLGSFSTGAGTNPFGVTSDGVNFWIALNAQRQIARF